MDLSNVLDAGSVAVIGASRDEKKRGYQAIKVLQDGRYEGIIFPVNPGEERILGLRCYPSVLDIPERVDLALITTPASTIPSLLQECGKKEVAGAVIIAGGFGELGEKGRKLQDRIVEIARDNHIRIIGPNTSGMVNTRRNLNLLGLSSVPQGDIALLSQSGNMSLHLITEASLKSQKGFSYYVGVGNEADIKFHEYLEFFRQDPSTRAVIMYVEGMSEGRRFLQQAYRTTREKPVILLKSGRSARGRKSAGSHTGALAGMSEVARTAFKRAGITYIENSDELFPAAETLSSLPPIHNNKVAILADGGGHATIAADMLTDYGIQLPELGKKTREGLARILSPNAALRNPVDVAGSTDSNPALFADCARILLEDEHVGGVLLVGLFGGYAIRFADRLRFMEEDAAHQMGKLVVETKKPILVHSLYKFARPHALELLRYYGIPVSDSVDISCKCISVLSEYGHYVGTHQHRTNFVLNWGAGAVDRGTEIIESALESERHALLEHEAKELMMLHGARVSVDRLATTGEEAVRFAREVRGPVALKIASPQILHKSDAGGVRLGLQGDDEVRDAFTAIMDSARKFDPEAEVLGCVVSPMAGPGAEVIIGTKEDEQFGPVIMFGIGGVLVEVLKDVSFRVLPISRLAAQRMIGEIRSSAILNGFRGRPPADRKAIARLLTTVSEIVEAYPQIREMDLNPVIVHEEGLTVVDARVILKKGNALKSAEELTVP